METITTHKEVFQLAKNKGCDTSLWKANENNRMVELFILTIIQKWLREEHNLVVETTYATNIKGEAGFKYHVRLSANYNSKIGLVFPYNDALLRGINEALQLIK